jgi:hypothetical protein
VSDPHVITEAFKGLDVRLATQGHDASTLAGCHVGLGITMLRELGWTVDAITELVRTTLAESFDG